MGGQERVLQIGGMARRLAPLWILPLLLLSLLPFTASAHDPILVIREDTTLTADLFGHIFILSDGVTLDCAGHTIIGVGPGVGIELHPGQTGVTVKNCEVTGFVFGILLSSSTGNTFTGNTATDNSIDGFAIFSGSDGNTFTGNTATDNFDGFVLSGSTGNTFSGNTATWNNKGFRVSGSTGNTFSGNTATVNVGWGMAGGFVLDSSSGNTFTGNTANSNTRGFRLDDSDGNTFTGNTANSNHQWGFSLDDSNGNNFTGNTATDNVPGFGLDSSSGNNFTGNTATDNVQGFVLGGSSMNTFRGNTATGSAGTGFRLAATALSGSDGNTFTGNTATGNEFGFRLLSSSGNTIFHNNIIGNTFWFQATDTNPAANDWHDPVSLHGNFWSDYDGDDDGIGGRVAGDGIGDTDIPWPGPGFDNYPFMARVGFTDIFQGNHINIVQLVQASQTLLSIPAAEASYVAQGFSPRCHLESSPGELGIFLDDALFRFELSVDGSPIPLTRFVTTLDDPGCLDGVGIRPGGFVPFAAGDYLGPHTFTTTIFRDQDFDGVVDPTPLVFTLTVDFEWEVAVLAEEPVTATATVQPDVQEFRFESRWAGSDVGMTLKSPLGRMIDRWNVTMHPDVTHELLPTPEAPTSESFTVRNPEAGEWTIELVGLDVPPEGEPVTLTAGATIEARIDVLVGRVAGLVDAGELNEGQGSALTTKLEGAIRKLSQGDAGAAIHKLQVFINHVNSLIDEGVLSPEKGRSLIGQAEGRVVELGG